VCFGADQRVTGSVGSSANTSKIICNLRKDIVGRRAVSSWLSDVCWCEQTANSTVNCRRHKSGYDHTSTVRSNEMLPFVTLGFNTGTNSGELTLVTLVVINKHSRQSDTAQRQAGVHTAIVDLWNIVL
jgi:hypothetical protein